MKSGKLMAAALVAAVMAVASTQPSTAAQKTRSADIVIRYDNGGSVVQLRPKSNARPATKLKCSD